MRAEGRATTGRVIHQSSDLLSFPTTFVSLYLPAALPGVLHAC
jgi:hypothetical protein